VICLGQGYTYAERLKIISKKEASKKKPVKKETPKEAPKKNSKLK